MPQFSEQIRNITRIIDSTQQIMKKSDATIKPEQYCFTQGLSTHGQVDKKRKGRTRDTKPVLKKKMNTRTGIQSKQTQLQFGIQIQTTPTTKQYFQQQKNVYELIKANLKSEWQTDTTLKLKQIYQASNSIGIQIQTTPTTKQYFQKKNVYELIKANLKSEWQTDTTLKRKQIYQASNSIKNIYQTRT